MSADRNKDNATIGVIPVDSIFSPVRRVDLRHRAHPGRAVDRLRPARPRHRDRRLHHAPRGARLGGDTLRSLVGLVAEMSDDPQGLELGEVATATTGSPDLDLPIEDLDLSERPRNCLKRAQVNTIGELLQKTEDDLLAITNFGQKSLDEVIQKLDERGLTAAHEDRTRGRHASHPKKGRRFGGSAAHQKAMMANLVASLVAAEAIVTTEAKAKALRPVAEKVITKAKKGGSTTTARSSPTSATRRWPTSSSTRSGPRYADRTAATRASSSSAPARATTRRWRASNWSDRRALFAGRRRSRAAPGAARRCSRPSSPTTAVVPRLRRRAEGPHRGGRRHRATRAGRWATRSR